MSVTKAFLLGAGLGTRLRPLTNNLPKPLIPVFNVPLIQYAIEHCAAAGITRFAINTHHLPAAWENLCRPPENRDVGDRPPSSEAGRAGHALLQMDITLFHEPTLLETGGGLKNIEPWIAGDSILVYNGDILAGLDLHKLLAAHQASDNVVTLGLRSQGPALHVAFDGHRVSDIHHKLGVAEGSHQFTGIYCIEPELLEHIPARRKISVIPALLELAREGRLGGCLLDQGYWLDLGTREAYLAAHRPESPLAPDHLINPEASIGPDAKVIDSVVGPGCAIGAGAVVRDCVLWPNTSVASGARLTNCILYSSTPATGTHQDADL